MKKEQKKVTMKRFLAVGDGSCVKFIATDEIHAVTIGYDTYRIEFKNPNRKDLEGSIDLKALEELRQFLLSGVIESVSPRWGKQKDQS